MRFGRIAVLALAAVPAVVQAQRGMGGGGMGGMGGSRRGGRGGMGGEGSRAAPKFPVAKDLEKLNPAALLVDKHRKLSLNDSLVATLKSLELKIYERNGTLLARYDSVRKDYKPPSGTPSTAADDKAQADAMVQMRMMRGILDSLIERRRVDVQESLGLVPEDHKRQAAEFLDKQDKEFLEQIPSSGAMGGGGGGRRGGRPGNG
jgi:hypothetical protein